MNLEQPRATKIEIGNDEKEILVEELENIERVLQAIENGDDNFAYADTNDSMESIDDMLSEDPIYQNTLAERKQASKLCMGGNETEKSEGLRQVINWVENIRSLI